MKRAAIIGGGAAGLCCADALAKDGRLSVTVFEQNERVGKKLLSTGNGRCNLTNLHASPGDYSAPEFVMPALTRFSPQKVLSFFESLSLYTHADGAGRVYPLSNQASGVLDALRLEAQRLGVSMRTESAVTAVTPKNGGWLVNAERFDYVVFACGGKAAVKTHNAYDLLHALGVPVTKTAPGLVKLTTSVTETKALKGVRAAVCMTLRSNAKLCAAEEGELLFGDGVLSGIAAMNLSSVMQHCRKNGDDAFTVDIDFVPSMGESALAAALQRIVSSAQRTKAQDLLSGFLPKAVGLMLLKAAKIAPSCDTAALDGARVLALAKICKCCPFPITGTKSFPDAQVTLGGADNGAFFAETLEAKRHRRLYCIGELLDVDAPCGGYNLQWAFSSALLCAETIRKDVRYAENQ